MKSSWVLISSALESKVRSFYLFNILKYTNVSLRLNPQILLDLDDHWWLYYIYIVATYVLGPCINHFIKSLESSNGSFTTHLLNYYIMLCTCADHTSFRCSSSFCWFLCRNNDNMGTHPIICPSKDFVVVSFLYLAYYVPSLLGQCVWSSMFLSFLIYLYTLVKYMARNIPVLKKSAPTKDTEQLRKYTK